MSAAASSTQAGLLQAILDEPAADDLRLIYADWLEEHGEPARAEFIRVQCAIAEVDRKRILRKSIRGGVRKVRSALCRREWELLEPGGLRHLPGPFWRRGDEYGWSENNGSFSCVFHRGLVVEIICSLADWITHGPSLVQSAPLERVTLTDRQPLSLAANTTPADPWYGWYTWNDQRLQINTVDQNDRRIRIHRRFVPAAYDLPTDLLALVPGQRIESNPYTTYHPSAQDALNALSAACLAWAKAQPAP